MDVPSLVNQYVVDKYELGMDCQGKTQNEFEVANVSQVKTKQLIDYLGTRQSQGAGAANRSMAPRPSEEAKKGSNSGRKQSGRIN